MIGLLYPEDPPAGYASYLPELKREYSFWMHGSAGLAPGGSSEHVVALPTARCSTASGTRSVSRAMRRFAKIRRLPLTARANLRRCIVIGALPLKAAGV